MVNYYLPLAFIWTWCTASILFLFGDPVAWRVIYLECSGLLHTVWWFWIDASEEKIKYWWHVIFIKISWWKQLELCYLNWFNNLQEQGMLHCMFYALLDPCILFPSLFGHLHIRNIPTIRPQSPHYNFDPYRIFSGHLPCIG